LEIESSQLLYKIVKCEWIIKTFTVSCWLLLRNWRKRNKINSKGFIVYFTEKAGNILSVSKIYQKISFKLLLELLYLSPFKS